MKDNTENRRDFLGRTLIGTAALPLLLQCGFGSSARTGEKELLEKLRANGVQDPNCEWCGARDVPDDVRWKTRLDKEGDEGERLLVTGSVYEPDGRTPAANVLLYFYHTDTEGLYGRKGEHRHGRYRGWVLTGENGEFSFLTIKPSPYPARNNPAHIHMTRTTVDRKENWVDTIFFEGDPLLTKGSRNGEEGGFSNVLELEKGDDGILRASKDLRLDEI